MNKTLNLNDNYGKRLRDEIISPNSNSGLMGEVEIRVKNKETGEIESQQKHNLIVYGGREWLLKKAFNTNVSENLDFIKNSEILWFGVGNGGGEPGNPLQCGCTYGSDNDLYNPVRLRYEFNTSSASVNPYYASRIMANGEIVNGYYKKITYVNVKEDQANPYKKNNSTLYPNLIAEVRLEISSDDCCGQTYLNNDYEKSYSDINEAALFIADSRLTDPGQTDKLNYQSFDYTKYNTSRLDLISLKELPVKIASGNKYFWNEDKPFPNDYAQYFDVYRKVSALTESESDYKKDGVFYKLSGNKLNNDPILVGVYNKGTSQCTGSIELISENLVFNFVNGDKEESYTLSVPGITSMDDIFILTHGSIAINTVKTDKIENNVKCRCMYRNSYTTDFTAVTNPQYVFLDESESESETKQTYRYILPIGYVLDEDSNWVEDNCFTQNSIVRVVQSTDLSTEFVVQEIECDPNSLECKVYVSNDTISKLKEGMKFYTYNDSSSLNQIPESNPSTINEIYDAVKDTENVSTTKKSYFTIERTGLFNETYNDTTLYPDGGLCARSYIPAKDTPYIMFNRVTFSTIRVSKNRLVDLIWRIYF